MSDASDIIGAGLSVALAAAIPAITSALAGGTPPQIVGAALVAASHDVAIRRVEARTHERVHPLVVEAVHLEDAAARLDVLGHPISAAHVRIEATELRKRAAALAPTEPAPSATPTSDR